MDIRYAVSPLEYRSMGSAELRDAFLIDVFKAVTPITNWQLCTPRS